MFVGAWKRFLLERLSGASPVPDMSNMYVYLYVVFEVVNISLNSFQKGCLDIIPATAAFHQLVSQPETSR